jgi:WD40 repeat protein
MALPQTFSPDSQQLATATQDGTVKIWDARQRPEARLFQPEENGPEPTGRVQKVGEVAQKAGRRLPK